MLYKTAFDTKNKSKMWKKSDIKLKPKYKKLNALWDRPWN